MAMEVTKILLNAQSADGSVRKHAEESLKHFQEQNLPGFLSSLSAELASEEKPIDSRKLSGLILKNALDAKEQRRKFELVLRWLSLDVTIKTQIKSFLLQTLSSPVHEARSTASQVIAKVAGIELPQKQWPELITCLLINILGAPAHVKQATLKTLGYMCEEFSPDVVQENKSLTAVVQGMNASEASNDVRLADTRVLYNALTYAQANFSDDLQRHYIMGAVCEATLSPEVKTRQAAYECLVAISSSYYEKLFPYIQDIFWSTANAVKEDEEAVALPAVEFWSSICDKEIDIIKGGLEIPCFYFIKQNLLALVPMLLETLLKQEEDQDEGAWNLSMAGGTCLGLVARTVGDDIVPLVMPFIETNITKPDWRQREGATYAFGSILEGPSPNKLTPLVNVALNFMLTALSKDPHNHVKDTTAWTLGRIFEFLHGSTMESPIVTPHNSQQIITVLLQSMKDAPNVAEKACGALYFLAQDFGQPSPLTPFFQEIVQSLLTATHREDSSESRLRTAAYKTLNKVVRCSNDETAPMVLQLVLVTMMELHKTLEDHNLSEVQGLLCGCLQVIIQKQIMSLLVPYSPQIVQFLDLMYMEKDLMKMLESFSIQIEIMKRLPVKSVIRFRGVSKGWKSLIESSEFITAHSRHRHTHPHHVLVTILDSGVRGACLSSFSDDDNFPKQPAANLTVPPSLEELVCVFQVGTSHGLVCLDGHSPNWDSRKAVILNPSTRKSIIITLPERGLACLGFGVCPVTCDPKLLWIPEYRGNPAKVYKCSSGAWRSIAMPDEGHWNGTVTTKNFIYSQWVCENKIASFDLTHESFEATDLPDGVLTTSLVLDDDDDDDDSDYYYMSTIRESLALIVPISGLTGTTFDVWVLLEEEEEDGVQRSFTKLFNIITPSKFDLILGCSKNEMLMVLQPDHNDDINALKLPSLVVYDLNSCHTSLVVYDLNSNVLKTERLTYELNAQSKLLEMGGFSMSSKVQAYEETLLLLDCHNSV